MPELPEVETMSRQLQKHISGKEITGMDIYDSKLAHIKNLTGIIITDVKRNGKAIQIILDNGESVLIHLRMTGRLLWQKESEKPRYSRWHLSLSNCNIYLVDPRRFATVKVLPTNSIPSANDIMQGGFDEKAFIEKQGRRIINIKNLLMDQKAIAGIGNIYACEILHAACINPERTATSITDKEWKRIFSKSRSILEKATEKRGTSISDWRDLYGLEGENQFVLKVYGREGKKCFRCGGTIVRIKQGGRSTYYCPNCQK
ncbi:MAG: bifunctional DNA-formamidopyrimidine glycosylase/DNA-(apurinic or apyrimidinic site) lyase [Smithella sp.]